MTDDERQALDALDQAQAQLWLIGQDRFAIRAQRLRDDFTAYLAKTEEN